VRLSVGQQAPDFAVVDIYGRRISLRDYAGRKLLLSFHRAAVCPLCNIRTWHIIDRYPTYRRMGLEVVAFYESSPQRTHEYLDRLKAPFPVIADLERKVYDLYGLESSLFGVAYARLTRWGAFREAARRRVGGGFVENLIRMDGRMGRMPADFLIGPDLRIRRAYYGKDAGDFMLFAEIDDFARSW